MSLIGSHFPTMYQTIGYHLGIRRTIGTLNKKSSGNSVARTHIAAQSNQDITPLVWLSVIRVGGVVAATVATSAQRACDGEVECAPDGGIVPPGPPARPHHQQRTVSPGVLVTVTLPPPPRHRPQPGRAQPSRQWTVLAAWRSPAPAQPSPASPGSCSQQLIRQM